MNAQQLIEEANELPVEDRALLVDSLLHSLNGPSAELDQQWLSLAQQRLQDLDAGKVAAVPAQEVFGKLWNLFDK